MLTILAELKNNRYFYVKMLWLLKGQLFVTLTANKHGAGVTGSADNVPIKK